MSGPDPRLITDDELLLIETLAGYGLTHEQISRAIGIPWRTFSLRLEDQPEVLKAIQEGDSKAIGKVTQTLFQMATSGTQPAATFFWLKTRAKWREVHHTEHTIKIGLKDLIEKSMIESDAPNIEDGVITHEPQSQLEKQTDVEPKAEVHRGQPASSSAKKSNRKTKAR